MSCMWYSMYHNCHVYAQVRKTKGARQLAMPYAELYSAPQKLHVRPLFILKLIVDTARPEDNCSQNK